MRMFFQIMAALIFSAAVVAGVLYKTLSGEAKSVPEQAHVEQRRRSSIIEEVDAEHPLQKEEEFDQESQQNVPVEKTGRKGTFWLGVVCCYVIMIVGEAQGLAFNNNIGDAYMAARKANVGLVTLSQLERRGGDFKPVYDQMHRGTNLRNFIEQEYSALPDALEIPSSDMSKLVFISNGGQANETRRTVVLEKALAPETVLYETKTDGVVTVQNVMADMKNGGARSPPPCEVRSHEQGWF
jgi:hypothetical protein